MFGVELFGSESTAHPPKCRYRPTPSTDSRCQLLNAVRLALLVQTEMQFGESAFFAQASIRLGPGGLSGCAFNTGRGGRQGGWAWDRAWPQSECGQPPAHLQRRGDVHVPRRCLLQGEGMAGSLEVAGWPPCGAEVWRWQQTLTDVAPSRRSALVRPVPWPIKPRHRLPEPQRGPPEAKGLVVPRPTGVHPCVRCPPLCICLPSSIPIS